MSGSRRYDDDEIREILETASSYHEREARALPATTRGLTAAELQEIGREVGLDPDVVARAVADFEARGQNVPRKATLGMPTGVGRVIPLPRAPTDAEWEILVSEMRSTFDANGEIRTQGRLREWSDGDLHALVEPTGRGYRLRLTDSRQTELGMVGTGGFLLAFALLLLFVILGKGRHDAALFVPAFFALMGGGMIARTAVALPRWAREREAQMDVIAGRATALLAARGGGPGDPPAGGGEP